MGTYQPTRRRLVARGALAIGGATIAALLATAGIVSAANSGSNAPSMEVLPTTHGLKYSQTVTIKGHHLPKGSGNVAATICGTTDASAKAIKTVTADDCAGAESIGKLVQLKAWQSNGEFETKNTLPTSKQQFGKNKRFCDKTHFCELVVADANPDKPAYNVSKDIFFTDQKDPSASTPTTKPKPPTTPGSTDGSGGSGASGSGGSTPPPGGGTDPGGGHGGGQGSGSGGASGSGSGDVNGGPDNPGVHVGLQFEVNPPSGGGTPAPPALPAPPPLPPQAADALNQICTQLSGAVTQAGGDPTALLTACSSIANGTGPQQLSSVLQAPSLLCVAGASAWQNNQQVTDACNQAATGVQPITSQIGSALGGLLP